MLLGSSIGETEASHIYALAQTNYSSPHSLKKKKKKNIEKNQGSQNIIIKEDDDKLKPTKK